MANLNKDQQFKNMVWNIYKDFEKFDKVNYVLNKIRRLMIEDVQDFNKMKVDTQFYICNTVYHISLNGKREIMNQFSMFKKSDNDLDPQIKKYDIEYGFTEPVYIEAMTAEGKKIMIESL